MVYVKLAQLPFVKTICETGFNAGHSALIWLTANVDAEVYSFDMGEHEYAKKMAKHLQDKYPGRLMVTWGDSTKTLPQFKRDHPEVNCDLIVVDGGHTVPVATADFSNLRNLASDTNIVVFDDYPSERSLGPRLAPVWETQVAHLCPAHLPVSYLGPFDPMVQLLLNYPSLVAFLFYTTLLIHVFETYLAIRLCSRMQLSCTWKWAIQTFVYGIISLQLLMTQEGHLKRCS
ncbi:hypothetical protein CAPTEDRAFT_227627, partial [Capitella teleta]